MSRGRRCHRVGADLLLMRAAEHDKALGCEWRANGTTLTMAVNVEFVESAFVSPASIPVVGVCNRHQWPEVS